MRLVDLSVQMLRGALDIYVEVAWKGAVGARLPLLEGGAEPVSTVLSLFEDETPRQPGNARRFILRLGNAWYPFMKFVLEEHLILGEFFLAVDTHDQMFRGGFTDETALEELRRRNAAVKQEIESRWSARGLPTSTHLKGLVATRPLPRHPPRNQRILVVDDDSTAAETLCLLLEARGFETERAHDGAQMLERADPSRHSLILMDVEMPVMNGLEACRRLKADAERRRIPVLLATAGAIDLAMLTHEADAFLAKPFQAEILFSFIDHLLPPPAPAAER